MNDTAHKTENKIVEYIKDKTFDLSPDAALILDNKGRFVEVNKFVEKWLGYTREEIVGTSVINTPFLDSKGKTIALSKFTQRLAGKEIEPYDLEVTAKNGHREVGNVVGTVVKDESGETVGILIIVSNVTKLRRSFNHFSALIDASPDAITATDLDNIINFVSPQTLVLHGYADPDELLGKSAFDLISPKGYALATEKIKNVMDRGSVHGIEYEMIRKDGSTFIGELSSSLVKDEEGKPIGFIAIVRDVSRRKELEKSADIRAEELEQLNKLMVGRELKMIELKKEIINLKEKSETHK